MPNDVNEASFPRATHQYIRVEKSVLLIMQSLELLAKD